MESVFNTALGQLGIAAALVVGLIFITRVIWGEYKAERAAHTEDNRLNNETMKSFIKEYATYAATNQQTLQNLERLVGEIARSIERLSQK